jgi:hypothetical protein
MVDIKDFKGLYAIAEDGKVWSYPKRGNPNGKFINGITTAYGYEQVGLRKNGKTYINKIHRLVARAFLDNTASKPHINHIDGNKINNNVSNLEWCTISENNIHAVKEGLRDATIKIPLKELPKIRETYRKGLYSQREIAKHYGVCQATIQDILNGVRAAWNNLETV